MLIIFYQAMAQQDFLVPLWSLDHPRLISLSIFSYFGHPEEAQNSDLRKIWAPRSIIVKNPCNLQVHVNGQKWEYPFNFHILAFIIDEIIKLPHTYLTAHDYLEQ